MPKQLIQLRQEQNQNYTVFKKIVMRFIYMNLEESLSGCMNTVSTAFMNIEEVKM
jgi:hypothetical protein